MTQALVLIDIVLYRIFVRLKDTRFDLCAPVRRLRSALHVNQDESGRDRATEGQAVKRGRVEKTEKNECYVVLCEVLHAPTALSGSDLASPLWTLRRRQSAVRTALVLPAPRGANSALMYMYCAVTQCSRLYFMHPVVEPGARRGHGRMRVHD